LLFPATVHLVKGESQMADTSAVYSNPIIKKVILAKGRNNIRKSINSDVPYSRQNLVLVRNLKIKNTQQSFYKKLKNSSLSEEDSSLIIPLSMTESNFCLTESGRKNELKNNFSTLPITKEIILRLLGEIEPDINFCKDKVNILGKGYISPLSEEAINFYNFSTLDSIDGELGKQYRFVFQVKDQGDIGFKGNLLVDSATSSIVNINAFIPYKTGNIKQLSVSQNFLPTTTNKWVLDNENMTIEMKYQMESDSIRTYPSVYIYQSISAPKKKSDSLILNKFAKTNYSAEKLSEKISNLNAFPFFKTSTWIASAVVTGYVPFWKFDMGKIQYMARLTDVEGLRLTLPLQTNEKLWKNISLGGYAGYGFRNNEFKYSTFAKIKLSKTKRTILGISYTNDYRRVDYDYNDFVVRENPLATGDIDIGGTILAFHSVDQLNLRKETEINFATDWNDDIETNVFLRNNDIYAASSLPLMLNGVNYEKITQQSVTVSTRCSFDERVYDKHMHRSYVTNTQPVIYALLEGGKYFVGDKEGVYAKISTLMHQKVNIGIGYWDYLVEGGCIFGKVPYALLEAPYGRESSGYNRYQFSLLNYMEYAADKYVSMHNEVTLNGVIMNKIPYIKYLNLRELITFKSFYGTLQNKHSQVLDLPPSVQVLTKPYSEVGVGFSNILHLFTLQSIWRLTDNHQGKPSWGIKGSIRITF
jgi:hypothetical protein